MKKVISFLSSRKELTISLVSTYFIFILFMHDFVVKLSVWLMNTVSRGWYNSIIGGIMIIAMVLIISLFVRNVKRNKQEFDLKIFYMAMMIGLVVIHTQVNFVMNIEIIHTLQFGIIALLIFPLTRSFGATLYYTVLLGAVDEIFQYAILYPDRNDYLDFNDIILDQLGAGIMLVYLYSTGARSTRDENDRWFKSPVLISTLLIAGAIGLLFHFSLMSTYYAEGTTKPLFVLSESSGPENFWRHVANTSIVYHVMSPLEGVVVFGIICGLFFLLDFLDSRATHGLNVQQPDADKAMNVANENGEGHLKPNSASSVIPLTH